MSEAGTFETCRPSVTVSAFGARENRKSSTESQPDAIDPNRTRQNDRSKFNVVLHGCEGTEYLFLRALLVRSDKGERAMSLRSVTEKIDNIIFGAVVVICLLIWAVLGFPLVIEIATTAVLVIVIYFFWRWMEFRH
jgi:hypothetical protein